MFNYNPKAWFSLIFHAYSKQVLRTLLPALVSIGLYTAVVCYVLIEVLRFHENDFTTTIAIHSLLGVVLGLFLVFRVNSAYDRWWEGRKLWGSLVNNTRNFAQKINAFMPKEDVAERKWFVDTISNLAMSLKNHLQKNYSVHELYFPGEDVERIAIDKGHIPNKFCSKLYEKVNQLFVTRIINDYHFLVLDKELKEFSEVIGGCERIRNTPIPYSYAMYLKKFIFVYMITLPFGFVTTSGYMTIPIVVLISFLLLSVELIAEEIENPFGEGINDLPIHQIAVGIRKDITEILQ